MTIIMFCAAMYLAYSIGSDRGYELKEKHIKEAREAVDEMWK